MGAWLSLLFVPPSKVVSLQGRKLIIKKSLGEGGFSFVYLVKGISIWFMRILFICIFFKECNSNN